MQVFTLQQYIDHKGATLIANELGVDEQTVYYWKHKRSAPKPHTAYKMIQSTGGLLSWQGIYEPFVQHNVNEQLSFDFGPNKS